MSEHTKEPWKHLGDGDIVDSAGNDIVCVYLRTDGDHEATASRIVACVNACAGIPTANLLAAAKKAIAGCCDLAAIANAEGQS